MIFVMGFAFPSSLWHRIYPELCRAPYLFLVFDDRACVLADREAQIAARGVSVVIEALRYCHLAETQPRILNV